MQRRILLLPVAASPACAQLGKIFEKIIKPKGSDNRIIDGLKEALRVGTANAIHLTGRTDGYFANMLIRILMPEKLRALEKGMRVMGMGKQVDAFILAMNRSAEAAAPLAREIFVGAIGEMTIDDARRLLTGGDTAATSYFQTKTTEELTAAFRPVVAKTMAENQVGRHFQNVLGAARKFPLIKTEALDIESHVVAKSLVGLFLMIGNEERKIRKDPAARATAILKEVFGQPMPLQNRVTPFGEIIATEARGTLLGNRGLIHNAQRRIVRPFRLQRWIYCRLQFKGRQRQVMTPGLYTELFFMDEATAWAAGHRPCAECLTARWREFRRLWAQENLGLDTCLAGEIDARLHVERLGPRPLVNPATLPTGAFYAFAGEAYRVDRQGVVRWTPHGYAPALVVCRSAELLTPLSLVAVLRRGFNLAQQLSPESAPVP